MPSTSRSWPLDAEGARAGVTGPSQSRHGGGMGCSSAMAPIFHIAEAGGWAEAQANGLYGWSTVGRTVEDEGFIHCSYRDQIAAVANTFYAGRKDLLLLVIDPARVASDIREEAVDGSERFPHIYGPLNLDAVTEVRSFLPREDGRFLAPDWPREPPGSTAVRSSAPADRRGR